MLQKKLEPSICLLLLAVTVHFLSDIQCCAEEVETNWNGKPRIDHETKDGECLLVFHGFPTCPTETVTKLHDVISSEPSIHTLEGIKFNEEDSIGVEDGCQLMVHPPLKEDRSCLLVPKGTRNKPTKIPLSFDVDFTSLISNINDVCGTYLDSRGGQSLQGMHREHIVNNLFSVQQLDNHVTMADVRIINKTNNPIIPQCERVTIDSWSTFFHDYLQISKPVIITNAMNWTAQTKWTSSYLVQRFGGRQVHVKLSPTSDYEGIESYDQWMPDEKFSIPQAVMNKLPYPDLVVPRPAGVDMNFSQFADLMNAINNGSLSHMSAYLEYTSIRHYFKELEEDLSQPDFMANKLNLKNLNIWLSDGNTLGKLHFDPMDNLLCQLDGRKEVILFEPHHNEQLYEGHIPEAEYSYDSSTMKFQRSTLLESTRMVMSPFDIRKPNYERFPLFAENKPLNCTINPGEILFMPAFWWHEVQSYPNPSSGRNLAVNFWYEPFLNREFPCPTCRLDVNPVYRDLL